MPWTGMKRAIGKERECFGCDLQMDLKRISQVIYKTQRVHAPCDGCNGDTCAGMCYHLRNRVVV